MKLLTIASLFVGASTLAASPFLVQFAHGQSSSEAFCQLFDITEDSQVNFVSGKLWTGEQCTLANSKKLSVSNSETTNAGAAYITINRFTFKQSSALWYFAGSAGSMENMIPYHLRVSNCVFERNAGFVLQGAFPKNSNIEVSGNTWVAVTSNNLLYAGLGAYCILFYDTAQAMLAGSKIRIINNQMSVSMNAQAYGVMMNTAFTMNENAHFEVSSNVIDITSGGASFPAAIGMLTNTASMSINGENTKFVLDNNTITAKNAALGMYLPVFNTGGRAMTFNITNNRIGLEGTSQYNIRVRGLNVAKASVIDISGNNLTSAGTDCRLQLTDLTVGGQTLFYLNRNRLRATGSSSTIAMFNPTTIKDSAKWFIEGNDIQRVDNTAPHFPSIHFQDHVSFADSSSTSISNNIVSSVATPANYFVYCAGNVGKAAGASISICNNWFYGSWFVDFSHYMSAGFYDNMANQSLCPAIATPAPETTTTTTAATTSATTSGAVSQSTAASSTENNTVPVITGDNNSTIIDNSSTIDVGTTTGGNATTEATTAPSTTAFQNGVAGAYSSFAVVAVAVVGCVFSAISVVS